MYRHGYRSYGNGFWPGDVAAGNHVLKEVTHIGTKEEAARRVGRTA
jgi:hypothetical protein